MRTYFVIRLESNEVSILLGTSFFEEVLTMLVLFRLNLLSLLAAIEARLRLGSWVTLLCKVTGGTSAIVCCLSIMLVFEALLLISAFDWICLAC